MSLFVKELDANSKKVLKGVLKHKADVNEDGFLSRDQIFMAFAECGHWAADSDLEFLDKVLDSDGKVHIEEVLENLDEPISVSSVMGEELNEAFKMFDKYGDGTIRRYELLQILKAKGQFKFDEEEAKAFIDELVDKYNPKDTAKLQYTDYVQQFTTASKPEEMEQLYMLKKYKL